MKLLEEYFHAPAVPYLIASFLVGVSGGLYGRGIGPEWLVASTLFLWTLSWMYVFWGPDAENYLPIKSKIWFSFAFGGALAFGAMFTITLAVIFFKR